MDNVRFFKKLPKILYILFSISMVLFVSYLSGIQILKEKECINNLNIGANAFTGFILSSLIFIILYFILKSIVLGFQKSKMDVQGTNKSKVLVFLRNFLLFLPEPLKIMFFLTLSISILIFFMWSIGKIIIIIHF